MSKMGNLMLSADGDVMLYKANIQILNNFENLIEEFFKWKKTNCYNEQLFVKFLQQKFGNESIKFIKNLGYLNNNKISSEYKNIKWYNF